jgi:hypothetical protein
MFDAESRPDVRKRAGPVPLKIFTTAASVSILSISFPVNRDPIDFINALIRLQFFPNLSVTRRPTSRIAW